MKTKSLFIILAAVMVSELFFSCSKKEESYKVTIKVFSDNPCVPVRLEGYKTHYSTIMRFRWDKEFILTRDNLRNYDGIIEMKAECVEDKDKDDTLLRIEFWVDGELRKQKERNGYVHLTMIL